MHRTQTALDLPPRYYRAFPLIVSHSTRSLEADVGKRELRVEFLGRGTVSMTLRCTVVHACPEYLHGDRLNYFHVPLGVNDRGIDDKAPVGHQFRRGIGRSVPLPPLNFLFFFFFSCARARIRGRIASRSQQPRENRTVRFSFGAR